MKKTSLLMISLLVLSFSAPSMAVDRVNGWSNDDGGDSAIIQKIKSHSTYTLIYLDGIGNGCGDSSAWKLPLEDTAKSNAKLSMLLAAFAAGQKVILRCETSTVTDFTVSK